MHWNDVLKTAMCSGILVCAGVRGQEAAATGQPMDRATHRLGSLIVHGERADDPVTEPLAPAASHELTATVIDETEIELARPRTATDALNFAPSFHKKRQGRKNEQSLTLRGMGNANILVEGLHLGTKEDARFVNHLPPGFLQDIRVLRDSSGLIYGPPQLTSPGGTIGFGGVIDFRLLEPGDTHSGSVRTEFGRFNENIQNITLSGPVTERLGYVLGAQRSEYGGPGGENMEDQYLHLLARVLYNYWGDSTLSLSVIREDGERELQKADKGTVFFNYREEYDPLETTISIISLNHVWTDDISTTVEAYYRDYEATYHRYDTKVENDLEETKKGIVFRQTVRFPETNVLRFGGEASEWSNPTGKLYYIGMERREESYSLYAQDEWSVIPDRLTLDAGVRWDRTYLDEGVIANGPGFVDGRPLPVSDVWQDPTVSYAVGASLRLTERQLVTARWALSKDAADSDIVSLTGQGIEEAEESRFELGYHVDICRQAALTVTAFYSLVENGLMYNGPVKIDGDFYPSWRTADFEKFGVELVVEGELARGLNYFANATWMNATVDAPGSDEDHDDSIPRWLAAGGLRYQYGPWKAAVSLKYTYEYQDSFGPMPNRFVNMGDYFLLDMNVGYTVHAGERFEHEIYCGLRNALNEHYQTVPGFDDPGRDVYVGYAVRW